jgi:hypothetical protein
MLCRGSRRSGWAEFRGAGWSVDDAGLSRSQQRWFGRALAGDPAGDRIVRVSDHLLRERPEDGFA